MGHNQDELHGQIVDAFATGTNRQRTAARGMVRQLARELEGYRAAGMEDADRNDGATWLDVAESIVTDLETNGGTIPGELRVLLEAVNECQWSKAIDRMADDVEQAGGPLTDESEES